MKTAIEEAALAVVLVEAARYTGLDVEELREAITEAFELGRDGHRMPEMSIPAFGDPRREDEVIRALEAWRDAFLRGRNFEGARRGERASGALPAPLNARPVSVNGRLPEKPMSCHIGRE